MEKISGWPDLQSGTFYLLFHMTKGKVFKLILITMYIYHALINAPSAHMVHNNLNTKEGLKREEELSLDRGFVHIDM